MSEYMYLRCDFSGIQRYVLGIKRAGPAQAKRLRARSFLLELFEYAALETVKDRLGIGDNDVLVHGGGGFLVRLLANTDAAVIEDINAELQRRLWSEAGGEVQISMGWGDLEDDARASLERRKRRPGTAILQSDGSWDMEQLSLAELGDRCDICEQAPGVERRQDEDDPTVMYCEGCLNARELGERLTRWEWMRPTRGHSQVRALGVGFEEVSGNVHDSSAFRMGRWIPRSGREPLTFEEVAAKARGEKRLAVLKADVDDMGVKVGQVASNGPSEHPSYKGLQAFSRSLHTFFLDRIQDMLRKSWPLMYTIYAGGDDLLLVGPWNITLDFAGALVNEFAAGPGSEYGLTLSAGVVLTPYRVPIRHAVERADALEIEAKRQPGKNSCAALDSVWKWDQHEKVIGDGKRLARWVEAEGDPLRRSFLHRLLTLVESSYPLRAAHWVYQVERNAPRNNPDFRRWAADTLRYLEDDTQRASEAAASIRYALLSTRRV